MKALPFAVLGLALLAGCGSKEDDPVEPPADPPAELACDGRFMETLADGACVPVTVVGVRDVPVAFDSGGYALNGLLSLPVTDGSYRAPAIVVVHGSGPHGTSGTVDGSLGVSFSQPVAVYQSLAEQLAWRGIAVLRYEKRSCFSEAVSECTHSVQDYPGDIDAILVDDFVEDARNAARFAASRPEIRPDDVIVAGHSQGGSFVPHLVASEEAVSGGIGLAAPGLPLTETLPGQLEALADHLEQVNAALFASDIAGLRAQASAFRAELPAVLDGSYPSPTFLGAPLAFWQSFARWMDRPASDLPAVDEPLLYLSGDLDFNVWPDHLASYEAWAAMKPALETELVAGLTHAFVPVVSGTPPLDHAIDPRFAPQVVDRIEAWMRRP